MAKQAQGPAPGTLEEWFDARPSWLRGAAQHLVDTRRMPTDADLDALATHCIEEAGGRLQAAQPPIAPGVILGAAVGPSLRIVDISAIHGVNALGKNARLDLSKADLTVVYGSNGSGKSGYARLVKHICGARVPEKLHGNVFAGKDEPVSAKVKVRIQPPAQPPVAPIDRDIDWKASDGPASVLSAVHVFDTATGAQLSQSANTASHLPRRMRFVNSLIEISDRVVDIIRGREKSLLSQLPATPPGLSETPSGAFIAGLKASLSPQEIDAACQFSEDQRLERVALEAALAQQDPAVAHAKVVGELERVKNLGATTDSWLATFGQDQATAIVNARLDAMAKRTAAQTFATGFFQGMPLPGVGEEAWRRMWAAAARFAQDLAYPGHAHPNTDDGARCVLCQQVLDKDAKARMESFAGYITNQLEADAAGAERMLAQLVDRLPEVPSNEHWLIRGTSIGLAEPDCQKLSDQVSARIQSLVQADAVEKVPAVDWQAWNVALAGRLAQLNREREALAVLLDPAGREGKELRLKELRGLEWMATNRLSIQAELALLKSRAELGQAIRLAGTQALTVKSNEIGESELAQGFVDRFNAELQRLGGSTVPVVMTYKREGKGKLTFLVGLRDSTQKVDNRDVLSEGEQRIVALAAFFADVTGSDRSLPVIFDDPISSLDQRFEEAVATRIIDLASTRQVIAFTHRLSLMVLVQSGAKNRPNLGLSPVTVAVESIARDGKETGLPATIDVFSMKPKAGFGVLTNRVGEAKKLDAEMRKILIKDACSNFRILVERTVEENLCSEVVLRFRREIQTAGRLKKLAAINAGDCGLINDMMTKYSAFEHSQSSETPTWLPDPDELLADIKTMQEWIVEFSKRSDAA